MRVFIILLLILPEIVFGQGDAQSVFYLFPASITHEQTIKDTKGMGLGYERKLGKNSRWSVALPVIIGLPGTMVNNINDYHYDNSPKYLSSFSFSPGIKVNTSRKKSRLKYAIGASVFYETGKEQNDVFANYIVIGPEPIVSHYKENYQVFGCMLTNSVSLSIGKKVSIGFNCDLGLANQVENGKMIRNSLPDNSFLGPSGINRFTLVAGYRW